MQTDLSSFDHLFKLQEIYLAQEISKELASRDIHSSGIAQKIIHICKESHDEDSFLNNVLLIDIGLSQNFIISLYHTIRQKLPTKNDLISSAMAQQEDGEKAELHQTKKLNIFEQAEEDQNDKAKIFPGLSIPNKDQIELDLQEAEDFDRNYGEDQKIQEEIQEQGIQIKHQELKREESKKKKQENDSRYSRYSRSRSREKKKNKQKHKHRRSRSDSFQKEERHKRKDKQKERRRSSSYQKDRSKRKKQNERVKVKQQILKVEVGKIYRARISKVAKTGCFAQLLNVEQKKPALIHSSHVQTQAIDDISRVIKERQVVWVKVLQILEDRIRISMKEINQYNGKEYFKEEEEKKVEKKVYQKSGHYSFHRDQGKGALTGIKIQHQDDVDDQGQASYGDMWEISRLNYMGNGPKNQKSMAKEAIQEINIEVNDKEPPFLTGQTTKTGINLSPVRVVKNPEGTLQREAMNASEFAKKRRQVREQQNKNEARDLTKILDEAIPQKMEQKRNQKRSQMTIKDQKQMLPIFAYKDLLVQACVDNNILIVIGETGSGKTTQITQYLHAAGFSKRGKIGCTQPRRVAAMSVAKRVCEEMDVKLGDEVGYSIRFEDYTSSRTIIKYMTDGMLLREALMDKYLSQYSVIMLDEAHERTINTDVLFGILKKVAKKRKDFLLIVTSATLEAKRFSEYFLDCKIFSIPGRTYNVQILYAKEPETDYLDASLMCVMQIHVDQPQGDILLFLTGQEEIDTACQILTERLKKMGSDIPQLIILPVYSALPSQLQTRIFEPAPRGKRKCVIATNIAEASLTIDGIFYVVDPGFAKIKIYNSKLGMDTLVVAPISQASAKQRAGRAGRTGPGKCYRIYTEDAYKNQMLPTSVPEIQRANLSNTVLELKAMGINDLINFDFMDAPPVQTLIVALEQLYYLSALDDEGLLTKLGRKMAEFPLEPPLSKMLLTSIDFGCTEEIVTIIAMLSVQNVFYRPKEKEVIADQKKTKFNHHEGDHLTYLAVYEAWKNQDYSASWCRQNYIQQRSLRRGQDVKKQILDLLARYRFKIKSCGANYSLIRKTIVSGFFFHAAKKDSKGGYRTLIDDHQVYIHPSSALFNKEPEWVIYHELVFTTKQYMRDVCAINPKWLIDVAPNYFKFTDQLGFTRKKRNQKLDPLDQKYGDSNAWRLSKRRG